MKRLDIALAVAGPVILGVWSWLTWPTHVTAVGVACITAPLYVAVVLIFHRQDADREWMSGMREWGAGMEAAVNRQDGDVALLFNAAHDHPDDEQVEPKRLPVDIPTSPSLDVAGEAARRVLEETPVEVGPTTEMGGQWREVNIGGERRRFYVGP